MAPSWLCPRESSTGMCSWSTRKSRRCTMSRFLISVILLSLIGKPLAFADLLSDEQIAQALQSNPEAIYEMVRKLYIVENAIPTLHIPTQRVILKENGDLVVEY